MFLSARLTLILRHISGLFAPKSRLSPVFVVLGHDAQEAAVQILGVFADAEAAQKCSEMAMLHSEHYMPHEVKVVESALFFSASDYDPSLFLD